MENNTQNVLGCFLLIWKLCNSHLTDVVQEIFTLFIGIEVIHLICVFN